MKKSNLYFVVGVINIMKCYWAGQLEVSFDVFSVSVCDILREEAEIGASLSRSQNTTAATLSSNELIITGHHLFPCNISIGLCYSADVDTAIAPFTS